MNIDLFPENEILFNYDNYWAIHLCKAHSTLWSNPFKSPARELLTIIDRGRNRGWGMLRPLPKVKQQVSLFDTTACPFSSLWKWFCIENGMWAKFYLLHAPVGIKHNYIHENAENSAPTYKAFILMHINQVQGRQWLQSYLSEVQTPLFYLDFLNTYLHLKATSWPTMSLGL